MTSYTITEHSGLGGLALEPCHVGSASEARAVTAAGGALLDSYRTADAVATAMLRYIGDSIASCGVAGSFATTRFRGLRLWVPDEWGSTLLRLGAECGWSVPVDDLVALVDGILAAPTS